MSRVAFSKQFFWARDGESERERILKKRLYTFYTINCRLFLEPGISAVTFTGLTYFSFRGEKINACKRMLIGSLTKTVHLQSRGLL